MTLRIAMLSFAHVHAHDYARQVRAHPEATIQCIWDDDQARGQAAATRLEVPYVQDLDAVLTSDEVDAVLVNAPTNQHTELFLAAARHGKHIFTEKALTITTEDAEQVVQAVRESGVQFMISLPRRVTPETLYIKDILDRGLIGRITMMRARIAHNAALINMFHDGSAWFGDAKAAGGGALFDLGCHTTDVMRWFLGPPSKVVAVTQNFSNAYAIDDNLAAVVEFKSGALGILDASWVHRAGPNPLEIYGTEGYIGRNIAPGQNLILSSTKLDVQGYILPSKLPPALPMPLQQWVSSCLHGTASTISIEDGRNLTELLEGIYRAANAGTEYRF